MTPATRPAWFFDTAAGSAASSATSARTRPTSSSSSPARRAADVVASQVGNVHHPTAPDVRGFRRHRAARRPRHRLHPRRLVHARRPVDLGRRPADDPRHRRLHRDAQEHRHRRTRRRQPPVPRRQKETRYIDCSDVALPYGEQLVSDVVNRTETAMPQAHCFLATELMLKAQAQAQRVTFTPHEAMSARTGTTRESKRCRQAHECASQTRSATSRREFLTAAGKGRRGPRSLAGFPAIVPASVLGARSPGNRINIGAIGTGRISRGARSAGNLEVRHRADHGGLRSGQPTASRTRKTLVNGYYAKKTGKPYDGVTGYARLPRAARQQGRRRRRHQHARSLARDHRDPRRRRPARTSTCRSRRR